MNKTKKVIVNNVNFKLKIYLPPRKVISVLDQIGEGAIFGAFDS